MTCFHGNSGDGLWLHSGRRLGPFGAGLVSWRRRLLRGRCRNQGGQGAGPGGRGRGPVPGPWGAGGDMRESEPSPVESQSTGHIWSHDPQVFVTLSQVWTWWWVTSSVSSSAPSPYTERSSLSHSPSLCPSSLSSFYPPSQRHTLPVKTSYYWSDEVVVDTQCTYVYGACASLALRDVRRAGGGESPALGVAVVTGGSERTDGR